LISKITFQNAQELYDNSSVDIFSVSPEYCYLDSFRNSNLKPIFFLQNTKSYKILYSLHEVYSKDLNILDIQSPYSYGCPIILDHGNPADRDYILNEAKTFFFNNNYLVGFYRIHPFIELNSVLIENIYLNRKTIFIDLQKNIWEKLEPRVRTSIRKARKNDIIIKKNITIPDDFIETVHDLYTQNLTSIHAKKFYYFNVKFFKKLLINDNINIYASTYRDEVVGFVIILCSRKDFLIEYHLSASNEIGKKFNANTLILWEIMQDYKNKNFLNFYLGGGLCSNINDRLFNYKKGFSNLTKNFYIGDMKFNHERYLNLKKEIKSQNNKIIFYRDEK